MNRFIQVNLDEYVYFYKALLNPSLIEHEWQKVKHQSFNLEQYSLFFFSTDFAGADETSSASDGQHRRAPADVKPFPYFIPATHIIC